MMAKYATSGLQGNDVFVHINTENEIFAIACTRSRQNRKCGNITLLFRRTARNCSKMRAARLFFTIRPIKSLLCSVAIIAAVVDVKASQ